MTEKVFNLFVYITEDYVRELGVVTHEMDGSDSEMIMELQKTAAGDACAARRYPVPSRYSARQPDGTYVPAIASRVFQQMTYAGRLLEVFDEPLEELGAGPKPLVCLTPVVDGEVQVDKVGDLPDIPVPQCDNVIERYEMPHYADVYMTDSGFDLPQLLKDDYFRAIRLLFQQRLFVSCAKLLMSFIDTVAYLHEGDRSGNFQRWLDSYVDMRALGVSAEEMWEFRNSLLHMTGVDSRKVLAGSVCRITFFVGTMPTGLAAQDADARYFNLHQLIQGLADGLEEWIGEFNRQPARVAEFLARYDRVLSDVRYEEFSHRPIGKAPSDTANQPDSGGA